MTSRPTVNLGSFGRPARRRADDANELFPSSDWRFLLPDPTPGTVFSLAGGALAETSARLGAETVSPLEGGADLGVSDRWSRSVLRRLAAGVRPGGTVYVEVDWPRWRPAGQLADRLGEVGLQDPVLYSLSPSRDRWSPSWWLPVGDPAALRLAASRFVAASGGRRRRPTERLRTLLTLGLLAAPLVGARHPWLLHPSRRQVLCAVAVRPQRDRRVTSAPGLLPSRLRGPGGRPTVAMRVGGSSTDQAMLFASSGTGAPELVAKCPTRPEELVASAHEADVLAALGRRPNPVAGVPRPVALPADIGLPAWGQTFVSGRPVADVVAPDNVTPHALAMTRWLIALARATERPGQPSPPNESLVEALDETWASLSDGPRLRRRANERIRAIGPTSSVYQHGDLGPWNVLLEGSAVRVVDWADARAEGAPLCDLHHYLVHLALCANNAYAPTKRRHVISDATDPASRLGILIDDCLSSYAAHVGLDRAAIDGLRVLTWMHDLFRRPADEREPSLYLDLLRAELDRSASPTCGGSTPSHPSNDSP